MTPNKLILNPTEAGTELGCSAETIYKHIHKGLIKAYRLGKRAIRISYGELVKFSMNYDRISPPILPSKVNAIIFDFYGCLDIVIRYKILSLGGKDYGFRHYIQPTFDDG